ncbi:MAG TPA: tetratricopeptide repeat protein [Candidatus Acidoferrales bacterium]
MRTRWVVLIFAAVLLGAVGGAMLAPQPADAVSRDMVELQQQVAQLLQGQQDMRSAMDSNNATIKTLVQQSLDSVNKLSGEMSSVQKSVQEVQANTGARIDTMAQQTQGLSDNLQDVQARVGKLSQQLTDAQNLLQSIDGKLSNQQPGATGAPASPGAPGAPTTSNGPADAPGGANPPPGLAPISADTLYQNALRDYTSGKYDLARQEFSDYIKNFPSNDLASNSQFYLGEIAYAQNDFKGAIGAYSAVLENYPRSFKLAASQLKKGMAELEAGERPAGIRDLRAVESHFPGSDESRRAHAKLREIGATTATSRTPAR